MEVPMITISLCMIVKNEENVLERCIRPLIPLMDEIIIVDTGSSDRTREIALQFTDKVYDFAWTGNFSDARNFSFSKATMDYIYCADADEYMDPENVRKFEFLKRGLLPEIEIVQMYYTNQLSHNTVYNYDKELRAKLYKRVRTFKWINPIRILFPSPTVQVPSDIEGLQLFVLSQIQRMVRMAFLADGSGAVPPGAVFLSHSQKIPDTFGKIGSFFNDRTPGGPHCGLLRQGQNIPESLQVFPVQQAVADPFHCVRVGCPLGIDIEHEEAVKSVSLSDALHGFQGVVQMVRLRGGGIDPNADERMFPPGAQDVPVFRIKIGSVEPLRNIIVR